MMVMLRPTRLFEPRAALARLAAACMLALGAASQATAASDTTPEIAVPGPAAQATLGKPSAQGANLDPQGFSVTFRELGAQFPLQLRGVDARNGVAFSVRADRVATGGQLRLFYSYSPALIPELSQINVLVNQELAASLPTPTEDAGQPLEATVDIPARLITDFNRVDIQLIGHYTLECEDPVHTSLWANVSNQTELTIDTTPLALQNDLSLLPLPFFDRRDVRRLELPFVFAGTPSRATLEAAGTLASWFGALADYRGAQFPVSRDTLPARGNAVVFATGQQTVAGIGGASQQGPTVSMVANPNDPYGKLLVISGRTADELKLAANALALGTSTLSGSSATITGLSDLAPRQPYDAPNWLRSDRPVQFGELVPAADLSVAGYVPDLVRVPLRLPPDLFGWREKGIPVDLKYRYSPPPTADRSALNVSVGEQFLSTRLLSPVTRGAPERSAVRNALARLLPDGSAEVSERMHVPLYMLPSQSQLQFHFLYATPGSDCLVTPPNNVRSSIEPDSTIDISGLQHFIAMPDLAAFGTGGFPFTRMADLSETAVVLPEGATESDYSTYLALAGRLGAVTGYPATGVAVVRAAEIDEVSERDLLVLASGANQPLLETWADRLPFRQDGRERSFRLSDLVYRAVPWMAPDQRASAAPARLQLAVQSAGTDAVVYGFESPLASRRSVVVLSSNDAAGLADAVGLLVDAETDTLSRVQGSLVVIRGTQVDSLAADQSYYVGRLDPVTYARWYLADRPLLLVGIGVLAALLLAIVMYLSLRARARRRLASASETKS